MTPEEAVERIKDLLETEVYHQAGPGEPHEVQEELLEIVAAIRGVKGRTCILLFRN